MHEDLIPNKGRFMQDSTLNFELCIYLQQNVWAENEREEKFVLLKQRSTHITVQVVGEVVGQVT